MRHPLLDKEVIPVILIPINAVTLPLITELNNGVEPETPTNAVFVWFKEQTARIISNDEADEIKYGDEPVVNAQTIYIRVAAV